MSVYKIINSELYNYRITNEVGDVFISSKHLHRLGLYELLDYDDTIHCNDSDVKRHNFTEIELVLAYEGLIHLGFTMELDVQDTLPLTKRFCYSELHDYLFKYDDSNFGCMLFGTRRTGKTILMKQAMKELIQADKKPIYVSVEKDAIDGDELCNYMKGLMLLGFDYIFIDEFTYATESLRLSTILTDHIGKKKVVFAATDSLMLRELSRTILFGRVHLIKTTYVSYKEYNHLFKVTSAIDYVRNGGILKSSQQYEEQHNLSIEEFREMGLDYVGSAIISNIVNCCEKFDLSQRYPALNDMTSSQISTLLYRTLQRCCEMPILKYLNRKIKSRDFGNLRDLLGKKSDILLSKNEIQTLEAILYKRMNLLEEVTFTQEQIDTALRLLKDIDCCVEYDSQIFVYPVCIRYAYACECILSIVEYLQHDTFSSIVTLGQMQMIIQQSVEGELLEQVVFLDSIKRKELPYKLRLEHTAEVDLVLNDTAYEIKRSEQNQLKFARWLFHPSIQKIPYLKNFVVLTNDKSEDVSCKLSDIYAELKRDQDIDYGQIVTVKFRNLSEFLLRDNNNKSNMNLF